ncbi:hypothetical protein CHS0354_042415 [Potamilus streckersoni]|uniref:Uncharacterized protein n=1 Tax=Potamilus streckersoni TaxID=2493646 RepID=A0AAE0STY9_9BIVA|nr:hypothetical protein CHS0354_042415 [Potamilus streckersoni]
MNDHQFRFLPGRNTVDAIFLLVQMQEKIFMKCFIQVLASTTHSVKYNLGCLDDTKCPAAQGKKRDDMHSSKIKEHPDNDVARDIDSQSDSTNTFIAICTSCCNSELCNIKGCAAPGGNHLSVFQRVKPRDCIFQFHLFYGRTMWVVNMIAVVKTIKSQ